MAAREEPGRCHLCARRVRHLTRHHCIPRTRLKNAKNRKRCEREGVTQEVVDLCAACHRMVHTLLTEKELERTYNTLASLREHPDIARFVEWVAHKPEGVRVKVRRKRE